MSSLVAAGKRVGVNALFLIPGKVGGSETYLCSILHQLGTSFPDLPLVIYTNIENHHHLRVLLSGARDVEFCCLRFHARNRVSRILREQTQLPVLARRSKLDLLWSPGYTAPLRLSCASVVTIFDMQYKTYPESLNLLARIVTDFLVRRAAVRCHRILTLSEFGRSEILRYTAAQAGRVCVTPAGADAFLDPGTAHCVRDERVRMLTSGTNPYLLTVGNTYPHKNIHLLVEVFALLANRIPHKLVLVGIAGRGEGLVRKAVERLDCPERLFRLQHLELSELAALYRGADLFVYPSLYEGFGLPVLEAMTCGVPVLTTRCGAIPEIGGDAVCYFDPHSRDDLAAAILRMIGTAANERNKMIELARRRAAQFTWRETARATLACFHEALYEAKFENRARK